MDSPEQRWTYESAHGLYRKAGWAGVLPLPPGKKFPPPDGFTGWHGADPSGADSQAWIDDFAEYRNTGQLALRMPATAVGIDVDHGYGGKAGGDTMAEAMRRWGPIPLGPHSSARGDGPSGIWFYRIPKGMALRTRIVFPELGLGSVEIIQRHHRYAVAWPSVHPETGSQYQWYGKPEAAPLGEGGIWLPRPQDLPPLPAGWLKALEGADEPGVAAADPATVSEFAKRYATGTEPGALRGVLTTWERDLAAGSSRHDAMLAATCMAAREVRMGRYAAADARAQLRGAFTLALAEAKPGQRLAGPDVARREFDSMWAWGVSQALALDEAELLERRERAQAGTASDPMTRPSADDFWTDEGELPRPPGVAPAAAEPTGGGSHYADGCVTDSSGATLYVGTQEREATPEELAELQYQAELKALLRKKRMNRDADVAFAAETRPPDPGPALTSLAMLLAEPDEGEEWRIDQLWPEGGKVLLSAPQKAGKTTLIGNLLAALVDGRRFLAREVAQGDWKTVNSAGFAPVDLDGRRVALFDFEMTRRKLKDWLRDQRIVHVSDVHVEFMRGRVWDIRDPTVRKQWAEQLRALNVGVLIVDPIGPVLGALGIDENDNSAVGAYLFALDALVREAGADELLVVHHTGHGTERARGASAFLGWPDANWALVRDEQSDVRAFRAEGRDVLVPETNLVYDRNSRCLSLGEGNRGSQRSAGHAEIMAGIVAESPGETVNKLKALARDTDIGSKVQHAQDAVRAAEAAGLIHAHQGPNRSRLHFPGKCEGDACPDKDLPLLPPR